MTDITIEHSNMVSDLSKAGEDVINDLSPMDAHRWHMLTGMMGEAVEIAQALQNQDYVNLIEELGDFEFYVEGFRASLRLDRVATLSWVVDKHKRIYPFVLNETAIISFIIKVGDLLDLVKKSSIYNKPLEVKSVLPLLEDIEVFLYDLRAEYGLVREKILEGNLHKLLKSDNARYKKGTYTNQQAQDRKDKE